MACRRPSRPYKNAKTDVETSRMRSVFKNLQNAFEKVMKTPRNPRRCCRRPSCSDPRYIKSARAELESNDNDKIANLQLQPQKASKTQLETKFSSIPACRPSQTGCSFGVSRGLSTQKNSRQFLENQENWQTQRQVSSFPRPWPCPTRQGTWDAGICLQCTLCHMCILALYKGVGDGHSQFREGDYQI